MRKMCLAGLAVACALAFNGDALAKTRHHRHSSQAPAAEAHAPLVVQRRSWLDPGTQVPVGSTERYVLEQTFYNQDPISANQRSWYMHETLPNRWEVTPYEQGLPFDFP